MIADTRYVNPYRLWHGSFLPEWLEQRPEISAGPKLCYARLARYAGKNGVAWPRLDQLAANLGVGESQVQRYLTELADLGLIEKRRQGMGRPNEYRFLHHAWMDETPHECDDGLRNIADSESAELLTPIGKRVSKENQLLASPPDGDDTPKRERPRDVLFDTLTAVTGTDPDQLTTASRGAINRALRDLRAVNATPGDVRARAGEFRKRWPQITLTPSALAKHWPQLGPLRVAAREPPARVEEPPPRMAADKLVRHVADLRNVLKRAD